MSRADQPERDRPDDVDALFSEIVADLKAQGVGVDTDFDDPSPHPRRAAEEEPPAEEQRPREPATDEWRGAPVGWDQTMLSANDIDFGEDDEHFVPPEPPPLPRPTKAAVLVLLFFGIGLMLLIAPGVFGIGVTVATPLGILALAAGLGFLLLRTREGPPPGSDPDSGAQV